MKPPVFTVDAARDPAAEQVIAEGLRRYNFEQCGISDGRALNVVACDPETHVPLGGITGHTSLGVLFIDLFFLPEELRRRPRDHSVQSDGYQTHFHDEGARVMR